MQLCGQNIQGLLIDIDGVLHIGHQPIPGAVETFNRLELPHLLLTNTTTRAASTLVSDLKSMGYRVSDEQLITAPLAAKAYLRQQGSPPCRLLLTESAQADFADYPQDPANARAVVIGDIGDRWSYTLLNEVFQLVMNGAELVALHKNKFWQTEQALQLDIGAFIAGLEYATGKTATVVGKPNPAFFNAALSRLGISAKHAAMIGDDIDTDVGGAQALGLLGVLVKTGKYRAEYAAASNIQPDLVLDSFAQLNA